MFSSLASMPVTTSFTDGIMINAHCLDVLKKMKDKTVSAIIIDPPYGAQTHNQNVWDIAWSSELWQEIVKECFRVLVKGGHMVVFASGKTIFDIHMNIASGYQTTFKESPSFYRMIWKHNSLDSGRVHSHTPRSQFEDLIVYFRTGEGQNMFDQGTLKKTYGLDQHVGRANVLEFYKDDCRNKPQPTVKKFFKDNLNKWTFDYKPEGLMRALIRDFTSPGHTVVDFCMRHGMTAVAAKLESRKFIVVELEKDAYKRAVSRYSELFSVPVPTRAMAVASPVSSPIATPVTTDVDSDSEEQVVATDDIPLGAVIKPIAIPMTTVMKRTRGNRVMEPEEVPPKRQAVSHEGKILDIGTPKRCTRLLVFKKMVSIDGDQYLVAYPDKIDQLKMMTIKKKDVQDYIGEISAADMESLGQAFMPSRF